MQGGGDDEAEIVDELGLEQRLGERDAPVHADVTARLLLELGDERDEVAFNDGSSSPPMAECGRRDDKLLDAVDEARERLDLAAGPKPRPVIVGMTPEQHSILGGDDAAEVLLHHFVEVEDEILRLLRDAVERE